VGILLNISLLLAVAVAVQPVVAVAVVGLVEFFIALFLLLLEQFIQLPLVQAVQQELTRLLAVTVEILYLVQSHLRVAVAVAGKQLQELTVVLAAEEALQLRQQVQVFWVKVMLVAQVLHPQHLLVAVAVELTLRE
jgi:hypothetical protein